MNFTFISVLKYQFYKLHKTDKGESFDLLLHSSNIGQDFLQIFS